MTSPKKITATVGLILLIVLTLIASSVSLSKIIKQLSSPKIIPTSTIETPTLIPTPTVVKNQAIPTTSTIIPKPTLNTFSPSLSPTQAKKRQFLKENEEKEDDD